MERVDELFVDQVWWYISRAAGTVAWVLLSVSVLVGLMISARAARGLPRGWAVDLHRFLSTLSLVFLAIHMLALVPDDFVHFGWAETLVPMASEWRPAAVAWGVVAFWLAVAVELTSLARPWIPHRVWRAIHFLGFAVWAGATVHLLEAGTDASHPLFRAVQITVISTVLALFGYRVVARTRRSAGRTLPIEEAVHVDEVDAGKR